MKKRILNSYFDKGLNRQIEVNEVLDLNEDRIEVLESVGVEVEDYHRDESDTDTDTDTDTDDDIAKIKLIEAYKSNRNIVDGLFAPDLKILCDTFNVNYTNVSDAKESLKILTIG